MDMQRFRIPFFSLSHLSCHLSANLNRASFICLAFADLRTLPRSFYLVFIKVNIGLKMLRYPFIRQFRFTYYINCYSAVAVCAFLLHAFHILKSETSRSASLEEEP